MLIIRYRKIFYIFSGILIFVSISALGLWGLKLGIDFTGGSILEVEYSGTRPELSLLNKKLSEAEFGNVLLQPSGELGLLVRLRDISENEHQALVSILASDSELEELRFDSIGPTIGKELQRKALISIILVLVMILIFVTWSFRHVSDPVSSWKYGIVALIALAHDVIIPSGLFSFLGKFMEIEVDTLFVTALLTILGFSVHDTIVVFDRIRENIRRFGNMLSFQEVIGKSLSEVMGRSLATSFTLFIVLFSLYIFGESSTNFFILALLVGVVTGTYSSIFLASPLIVTWERWRKRT